MRAKGNKQVMVGMPQDAMYDFYVQEAKGWGVKLPTFVYQLLKDRYEVLHGQGKETWFPRGTTILHQGPTKPETPKEVTDIITDPSAALSAFGGEDED